jgi:regulator of nonsense transcripts 1
MGGAASFDVFSGRKWQRGAESEESSSEEEEDFYEDDGGKCSFVNQFTKGDGMRRMEDLQSEFDARSEVSGSTSRDQEDSVYVEPYDFDKLPAHACAYCGIHEPECVVKCGGKDCNKWFCNGKSLSQYGSHIILHMVKARHKDISLHPESPLKDTVIECYHCSSKNIFLLGFVPAKSDTVIILLCREPCLNQLSVKDSKWDMENWQPLIENKAILNWLVKFPPDIEFKRSRKIKPQEINKLEELWKEKP